MMKLTTEEIEILSKSDGFTLPSIKQPSLSGIKPKATPKVPGIAAVNKKNPVKQAEQLKNKEFKEHKMSAAKEFMKFNNLGQWSLESLEKGARNIDEFVAGGGEIKKYPASEKNRPAFSAQPTRSVSGIYNTGANGYAKGKKKVKGEKPIDAMDTVVKTHPNGQWSLEKAEAPALPKYHIHTDGARITTEPVDLNFVQKKYGGVKALEAAGHKLVPAT